MKTVVFLRSIPLNFILINRVNGKQNKQTTVITEWKKRNTQEEDDDSNDNEKKPKCKI